MSEKLELKSIYSDKVKERIEKLIGKPEFVNEQRGMEALCLNHDWMIWRNNLVDKIALSSKFIYGDEDGNFILHLDKYATITALMIDVHPIRKGVTKAEIIKELRDRNGIDFGLSIPLKELADRIESEGIVE